MLGGGGGVLWVFEVKKVQGQAWRVFCARLGVVKKKSNEAMSSGQMAQLLAAARWWAGVVVSWWLPASGELVGGC